MDLHLTARFTVDTWDVVDDPAAPATGRAVLAKAYQGGFLVGTAVGHALTTRGPAGASYVAQERITGTLDGRSGTLVLEHGACGGAGVDTVISLRWAATQRPDAKYLPTGISADAVLRRCLKVQGQVENDMVLGTSAYKNGTRATMFSRKDRRHRPAVR